MDPQCNFGSLFNPVHETKIIIYVLNCIYFFSECTSAHEESVTCPLEVSELEAIDNELSDVENKTPVSN